MSGIKFDKTNSYHYRDTIPITTIDSETNCKMATLHCPDHSCKCNEIHVSFTDSKGQNEYPAFDYMENAALPTITSACSRESDVVCSTSNTLVDSAGLEPVDFPYNIDKQRLILNVKLLKIMRIHTNTRTQMTVTLQPLLLLIALKTTILMLATLVLCLSLI